MKIRNATEQDLGQILAIVNYEILNATAVYDYYEKTISDMLLWYQNRMENNMPILVAEINNKVMGYGSYCKFRNKDGYQFSIEHSIYVAKEARGKGIGLRIMKELIGRAKNNDYHTMIAVLDSSNQGSYRFHQKFGFVEVGRLKEIASKFEKRLDTIYMQLILE